MFQPQVPNYRIIFLLIYLFIFGCVESQLLHAGFLQLWRAGLLFIAVHRLLIVVASLVVEHGLQVHRLQQLWHAGFSSCGTWAQQLWLAGSRAQAQQLWRTGLVDPQHVGSSWTRARTRVPCIGRQILNHYATREVLELFLKLEIPN